jgi:hypothetical protein
MADDALSKAWLPQKEELVGFGEIRSAFAGGRRFARGSRSDAQGRFQSGFDQTKGPLQEKAED